MEVIIASKNVHKIREIRDILKDIPNIDFTSLLNYPDYEPPEETEETFEGNALLKARDAAQCFNKHVIADDSGLVVPSLNGLPGVRSRRYAGEDATDQENRDLLLESMKDLDNMKRAAYYECCLALVSPDGEGKIVSGRCEGNITNEERGSNGFGYDPLFIKNEYEKTFAELDEATKNRVSHRRKAIDQLQSLLESLK